MLRGTPFILDHTGKTNTGSMKGRKQNNYRIYILKQKDARL